MLHAEVSQETSKLSVGRMLRYGGSSGAHVKSSHAVKPS